VSSRRDGAHERCALEQAWQATERLVSTQKRILHIGQALDDPETLSRAEVRRFRKTGDARGGFCRLTVQPRANALCQCFLLADSRGSAFTDFR